MHSPSSRAWVDSRSNCIPFKLNTYAYDKDKWNAPIFLQRYICIVYRIKCNLLIFSILKGMHIKRKGIFFVEYLSWHFIKRETLDIYDLIYVYIKIFSKRERFFCTFFHVSFLWDIHIFDKSRASLRTLRKWWILTNAKRQIIYWLVLRYFKQRAAFFYAFTNIEPREFYKIYKM